MIATRLGEYVVIEIAVPGASIENAGILLVDPDSDRAYLRFRRDLETLSEEDVDILEALPADIEGKSAEMGALACLAWLEENASNFVRVSERSTATVDNFERTLSRLYSKHISPKVLPFRTHLPLYGAEAAAGHWGREMDVAEEPHDWVEGPEGLRLTPDMFVARVTGRSMEPLIPANSLCIFRGGSALAGSRSGRLVLVKNYGEAGEQRFTVKRYKSTKKQSPEGWMDDEIWLEPLNPEYERWRLDEDARIEVIGEFVRVLEVES